MGVVLGVAALYGMKRTGGLFAAHAAAIVGLAASVSGMIVVCVSHTQDLARDWTWNLVGTQLDSGASREDIIEVLAGWSRMAGVKFPASTRFCNFAQEQGQDYAACIKIEIDKRELDTFIDGSPFKDKELQSDERFTNSTRFGNKMWYDPDSSQIFLSGEVRLEPPSYNNEILSILVSLDHSEKAVIYLEYWR
jgi:hypothetical protein